MTDRLTGHVRILPGPSTKHLILFLIIYGVLAALAYRTLSMSVASTAYYIAVGSLLLPNAMVVLICILNQLLAAHIRVTNEKGIAKITIKRLWHRKTYTGKVTAIKHILEEQTVRSRNGNYTIDNYKISILFTDQPEVELIQVKTQQDAQTVDRLFQDNLPHIYASNPIEPGRNKGTTLLIGLSVIFYFLFLTYLLRSSYTTTAIADLSQNQIVITEQDFFDALLGKSNLVTDSDQIAFNYQGAKKGERVIVSWLGRDHHDRFVKDPYWSVQDKVTVLKQALNGRSMVHEDDLHDVAWDLFLWAHSKTPIDALPENEWQKYDAIIENPEDFTTGNFWGFMFGIRYFAKKKAKQNN